MHGLCDWCKDYSLPLQQVSMLTKHELWLCDNCAYEYNTTLTPFDYDERARKDDLTGDDNQFGMGA